MVFAISSCVFEEILPVTPAEGSVVSLLPENQKKLKDFASPEERKAAIEGDLQEKKSYCGKEAVWRSQIPVVFSWKCTSGEPGPYRIAISETPDFARPIYLGPAEGREFRAHPASTKFKIGRKYYWKVIYSGKNGTTESAVSAFMTEDLVPRWIALNGRTGNVRDLGGYRTVYGRRVRQNMLLRGSGLNDNSKDGKKPGKSRLTDADLNYFLKDLRVRTDLDLRSTRETANMKVSPLGETVQFIQNGGSSYANIFSPKGKSRMAKNFRVFCDPKNYPIYFHCIGGADRTGSLAFILEAVLGIPAREIELDYERTFYPYQRNGKFWGIYQSQKNGLMKPAVADGRPSGRSYQPLKTGLMKYGKASDSFQKRAELYLMDCGITMEEIEQFRSIMLEADK